MIVFIEIKIPEPFAKQQWLFLFFQKSSVLAGTKDTSRGFIGVE